MQTFHMGALKHFWYVSLPFFIYWRFLFSLHYITFKYADQHQQYLFSFRIVDMALVHLVRYHMGGMYWHCLFFNDWTPKRRSQKCRPLSSLPLAAAPPAISIWNRKVPLTPSKNFPGASTVSTKGYPWIYDVIADTIYIYINTHIYI